jgi:LPS export ABC transporter permease LptG
MKLIHSYILRLFVKYAFITFLSAISLFLAVDFSERFDDLIEASVTWFEIVRYFAFKIPSMIKDIAIPVFAISTLITFEIMAHRREILALHASGINPSRYAKIIILASLIIAVGYLEFIDVVERPLKTQANTFWLERVKKSFDLSLATKKIKKGEIWYATRHAIYHIKYYNPQNKSFHGVSIIFLDDSFRIRRKVDAATMIWDGNQWIAQNAAIVDFGKEGISFNKIELLPIEIRETPTDFSIFQTSLEDLSLRDIIHVVFLMHREGVNPRSYLMEINLRLANASAIAVSIILVIAILSKYSRCSLRSEIKSVIYAMVGFGLFFGLFQVGVGLASSGMVPMVLGIWGSHVAATVIALRLLSS